MGSFHYIVLEYAKSDLDLNGCPFMIAVDDENGVLFLVLRDWALSCVLTSQFDREYIEDFIHELAQQQFRPPPERKHFLESIQSLGVGPIRTGTDSYSDYDYVQQFKISGQGLKVLDEQAFVRLLRSL